MGDFFHLLRTRVDANARRAADVYERELADFRMISSGPRGGTSLLEFAVVLRRRTFELAEDNQPFSAEDLAYIAAVGKERGEKGVSLTSHRQVLVLHSTLTLHEIHDAAGTNDLDALMLMLGWLAPQGLNAQNAYTRGYMEGQERFLPLVTRVQLLAKMLLANDPAAPELARNLGMPVPERYVVTVVRIAGRPFRWMDRLRDEVIEILIDGDRMPLAWPAPEEFVGLVPDTDGVPAAAEHRALTLAHDFAETIGRPCSVGTATARVHALAGALTLARQVSQMAPIEPVPRRVYALADVFVELGTAQLPQIDEWLRGVAERLSNGPDLVTTLDVYYGCDMNRLRAAASLHIHPRTLDYRLQRVRELTDLNPGSTRGIRVLNTVVARVLAGAWSPLN
ncbi:PucR family transcriptional regulator [Sphaerisporangium corydalis]|uniref:PucR family transcriptional regulator n=1 Tax=Sphaerisporangium corydalis TaxID=1441875 RepID=A0ABV9EB57_9ACTN|nr:helix-turn-helix domain-containing protein [Sphaerisporangium corydalis]